MEGHKLGKKSLLYSLFLTSLNPLVPTKIFPFTYNLLLFFATRLLEHNFMYMCVSPTPELLCQTFC